MCTGDRQNYNIFATTIDTHRQCKNTSSTKQGAHNTESHTAAAPPSSLPPMVETAMSCGEFGEPGTQTVDALLAFPTGSSPAGFTVRVPELERDLEFSERDSANTAKAFLNALSITALTVRTWGFGRLPRTTFVKPWRSTTSSLRPKHGRCFATAFSASALTPLFGPSFGQNRAR